MIDIDEKNRAFFWASVFIRTLQRAGVRHVIISPGSRSTPLTLAAAACDQIQTHVMLDERSAAFFALGIGKATDNPAALICTSGTAVANYYPAVIEARMSNTPLLLLTADRPLHLRNTGANQAIDQQNIFGKYPVFFRDVSEPVLNNKKLKQLASLARKAVASAQNNQGPGHLNFPFSKPLEPESAFISSVDEIIAPFIPDESGSPARYQKDENSFNEKVVAKIQSAKRPLIIVGQLAPKSHLSVIFELAKKLNAPVLSETGYKNTDNAIQGFEGFLRNRAVQNRLKPDAILRFGRQPASKSILLAVKNWKIDNHFYFSDSDQQVDIANTTTGFSSWNGREFKISLTNGNGQNWLNQWKEAEQNYLEKSGKVLAEYGALTDGHVYHHIVPQIPENWFVFASNSFPARDRSMFGQWKDQLFFSNRGTSGIDGITSTAMGVTAGLDRPGILFTGDLAFLHDTNALLNAKKIDQPLLVVVINNSGGSIFRMLPIAKHKKYFEPYFETPQQANINTLATSYGTSCQTVNTIRKLQNIKIADLTPGAAANLSILECQTDPKISMELRNRLWSLGA